jgi:hypothetical protein
MSQLPSSSTGHVILPPALRARLPPSTATVLARVSNAFSGNVADDDVGSRLGQPNCHGIAQAALRARPGDKGQLPAKPNLFFIMAALDEAVDTVHELLAPDRPGDRECYAFAQ